MNVQVAEGTTQGSNGLSARHILIDTSIYAAARMDLRSRLFRELAEHTDSLGLVVLYDDTLKFECERQIVERTEELARNYRKLEKEASGWNFGFAPSKVPTPTPIDVADLTRRAQIAFFSELSRKFNAQFFKNEIDLSTVLARYRAMEPPFHEQGSKEFPDAVIVEGAALWSRRTGKRLYVVTGDKRMWAAAEFHPELIPLGSLEELLQLITTERDPAINEEVNKYLDLASFDEQVSEALSINLQEKLREGSIVYVGNSPAGGPAEIDLLFVSDIGPFKVVGFDESTITCLTPIRFEFNVEAEIEWPTTPHGDDWRSTRQTIDDSDYNRAYIVLSRSDGAVVSVTLVDRIEFGDPREW